ncbi:MAG: radical SAM protein [Coriobacteriia bacterium]
MTAWDLAFGSGWVRMPAQEARGRVALIEAGSPGLNIYSHVAMGRGVALLATVLRDAGWDARAFIEDVSGKDSVDWDWVRGADVVGFSTITCTMPRTAELLERVRTENPGAPIVLGGPEPTCRPDRSLSIGADYVLRGEAESTLPRFLDALTGRSAEPLAGIPGLVWRADGSLVEGPPFLQLTREELDAVPLVDASLVHLADRCSVAPVWRARGCPQRCDFCEVCEIWPRYVTRDGERTVEELVRAEDAGYRAAFLIDDNAAADKPAFKDLLRAVARRGFSGTLVTQIRADAVLMRDGRLDRELLRLLKKAAGVTVVCVGVESADDGNLEALRKRMDASGMARALRAMRRAGLLVHGMFMALNSDTREIVRRNGEYARKYVTSLQYLFETPLPGTRRTARHEADGALLFERIEDLSLYDGMHVVVRPQRMAPVEMQGLVVEEYRRFYSSGRVVAAALRGAFARFRRLTEGQRESLARMRFPQRVKSWVRLHFEYKFAPVSFLAIGHRRIREMLRDPGYLGFEARLRKL